MIKTGIIEGPVHVARHDLHDEILPIVLPGTVVPHDGRKSVVIGVIDHLVRHDDGERVDRCETLLGIAEQCGRVRHDLASRCCRDADPQLVPGHCHEGVRCVFPESVRSAVHHELVILALPGGDDRVVIQGHVLHVKEIALFRAEVVVVPRELLDILDILFDLSCVWEVHMLIYLLPWDLCVLA